MEISQFFSEVKTEFNKIAWPKTDELISSVVVVLLLVVIFALYLGAIDLILYRIAQQIF